MDQQTFKTMEEMITYCRAASDFLCCKLTDVCPKHETSLQLNVREISHSSIVLTQKLSTTDVEEVWCGTWMCDTKVPVHVRMLCPQLHSKADLVRKIEIIQKLQHHNVVQLYGVSTAKKPIYVVFESLESGNLLHYLREGKGQCINFVRKIDLAIQVATGMDYLHSQLCVHRSLSAKSVFISERNVTVAKIANFRYAKILPGESSVLKLPVEHVHVRWSPPEVLQDGHFSLKSDIWSFGILLTEIITNGQQPYSDIDTKELLQTQVVTNHYQIPRSQLMDCPVSLYEVMQSCWRFEASKRPKFDFIITGLHDSVPFGKGLYSTQTLL